MKLLSLSFLLLFFAGCHGNQKLIAQLPVEQSRLAHNVIFMVGDGMGLAQISAAMQADGRALNIERAPIVGLIKTSSSHEQITDSAASATAFAIGKKTKNGAIGIDANGRPQQTILELLGQQQYATGLIATSTITHATPASFFAHETSRENYYEIAADMVDAPLDLFVGGGRKHFQNRNDKKIGEGDDRDIVKELEQTGFSFVQTIEQLKDSTGKVGFFLADGHPKSVLKGRGDLLQKLIKPSINKLQQRSDQGFFLMIEGSQIDWGGHANDERYVISELYDFDAAVGRVLDFAESTNDTLVVITADHETGGLSRPAPDEGGDNKETDPYLKAVNHFSTDGHSSVMVPVFAYGPCAELFSGIYENTEIHSKVLEALGRSAQREVKAQ